MKLYRGFRPQVETDSKRPDAYISDWTNGDQIWLRGTKSRRAQRTTDLFLEIDDDDVRALFYALIERHQTSGDVAETLELCAEAMSRLASCLRSAKTDSGKEE
jgi:hypothetical protein